MATKLKTNPKAWERTGTYDKVWDPIKTKVRPPIPYGLTPEEVSVYLKEPGVTSIRGNFINLNKSKMFPSSLDENLMAIRKRINKAATQISRLDMKANKYIKDSKENGDMLYRGLAKLYKNRAIAGAGVATAYAIPQAYDAVTD